MKKGGEMPASARWGDEVEAALGDELPSPVIEGPDKNGIKTVTEYVDEDGKKFKIIRKIKVKKVEVTVNHNVARRRHLKKFGNAANHPPGPQHSTTGFGEAIPFKLTFKRTVEEQPDPAALKKKENKTVSCRYCKGDHWSSKCPYKDALEPLTENLPPPEEPESTLNTGDKKGKYVPPSLRDAAGGKDAKKSIGTRRDDDFHTLKVSNISEDTKQHDLEELFKRFGSIAKIHLATDKFTKVSKGYAYVSFYHRSEAQNALNQLNGYGYDNLILSVEWSVRN